VAGDLKDNGAKNVTSSLFSWLSVKNATQPAVILRNTGFQLHFLDQANCRKPNWRAYFVNYGFNDAHFTYQSYQIGQIHKN